MNMDSIGNFWRRTTPLRLLAYYYAAIALLLYGLLAIFPALWAFLPIGGLEQVPGTSLEDLVAASSADSAGTSAGSLNSAIQLLISLFATVCLMLPIAWVYLGTRRRRDTQQSFVVAILLMPVVVTGVVTIVQDSLALAFSLAGIVAAVRFRNSLRDAADAIYIFAAIGVGLASGVAEIGIAAVMSFFFNYLVLILWLFNFGLEAMDQRWFSYNWMKLRPIEETSEEADA